jgi:3-hydroxymyristoyl/3-hydroxydecanoyl-(acyl carrier protein) dehydratase
VEQQELQKLARTAQRHPLWMPAEPLNSPIGRETIERILPHRDPFLLLDEITEVDLVAQAIRGRRMISAEDPVFRGHFPGDPIYPGVLQLEIVGQLGLCLIHFVRSGTTRIDPNIRPSAVRAVRIHFAQFLAPVRPGNDLTVVGRILELNDYTGICAGQILCSGTVCAFGVMEVYLVDE